MNACAHHHVGDIGILGVDKKASIGIKLAWAAIQASMPNWGKSLGVLSLLTKLLKPSPPL